jgi:hypothetical protein
MTGPVSPWVRRESNPHASRHGLLRTAWLPVTPRTRVDPLCCTGAGSVLPTKLRLTRSLHVRWLPVGCEAHGLRTPSGNRTRASRLRISCPTTRRWEPVGAGRPVGVSDPPPVSHGYVPRRARDLCTGVKLSSRETRIVESVGVEPTYHAALPTTGGARISHSRPLTWNERESNPPTRAPNGAISH